MRRCFWTLLFLTPLLFLFVTDRVLGLWGFAAERPDQFAHPPNFLERRKSIEFEYDFKTNSQGLRYAEIPLAKPEQEHRVLLVGDSFTEGYGIAAEKTFGALLEQHCLDDHGKIVRFINGGLSGTGPVEYWRLFWNVGLKYDIDGLLICLFANDVSNMPTELTKSDLYRTQPARHGLKLVLHDCCPRTYTMFADLDNRRRHRAVDDFVSAVARVALRRGIPAERIAQWKRSLPDTLVEAINRHEYNDTMLAKALLSPEYWTDALDLSSETAAKKYQAMVLTLNEMHAQAANRGIETALIFTPCGNQYDPESQDPNSLFIRAGGQVRSDWLTSDCEIQKRLRQWACQNHVSFLDLTPVFRQAMQQHLDVKWRLDGHWNELGHKVAAEAIENWMEGHQVFSFIRNGQT